MQRSALCRSRRELSNEYLLAKIGVDTAENEPLQVCPLSAYRSPRFCRERPRKAYLLSLSSADRQRLVQWAGPGRRLLLTWTTGDKRYLSLALNLAYSVRRHAEEIASIFVVIAADRDAYRKLQSAGFNVVLRRTPPASVQQHLQNCF